MLKKTIKYTDYHGAERTDDFYFNISRAELLRMQFTTQNGFDTYIRRIMDEHDNVKIYETFEKVVKMSFGEKMPDGSFRKDAALTERFMQTEAYSELVMMFFEEEGFSTEFFSKVVTKLPADHLAPADHKSAEGSISQ